MKHLIRFALLIALTILTACASSNCGCGREENPHLTLNLGSDWSCKPETGATVCRSSAHEKANRIVMWTMKEKGPNDSLEKFTQHFEERKTVKASTGTVLSEPMSQKQVSLNGQPWIDALQYQSELPGYLTRYLAAIDDRYSVLVTFSAPKADFAQFNKDMEPVISSLIIRR